MDDTARTRPLALAAGMTAAPARGFVLGWLTAWAVVGCAIAGGIVFLTDADLLPALKVSVLFAQVVGMTAYTSARMIFPLFARLPLVLRGLLQLFSVLSGTVFGTVAVALLNPLYFAGARRAVLLIVLANAVLALVVALALSTYDTMKKRVEESYALERELAIAREVQQGLLPREVPRISGLELIGICEPAVGVGGDYYDFVPVDDGRVALIVADVSGKGIPAALLMAGIQASVRSLCPLVDGPAQLNARLNANLFQSASPSRYATVFLGFFDSASGMLSYSNAGHLPPLLVRDRKVRRLELRGLPIGMFEEVRYDEDDTPLQPGDLLALYTDGVSETPNAGGEEFGVERLGDLLLRNQDRSLDDILRLTLDELRDWSGGSVTHDDVTLVLARAR